MRIGLVELLLILLIASLTIGPSAALWVGSTTCSTSSPSCRPQVSSYSVV